MLRVRGGGVGRRGDLAAAELARSVLAAAAEARSPRRRPRSSRRRSAAPASSRGSARAQGRGAASAPRCGAQRRRSSGKRGTRERARPAAQLTAARLRRRRRCRSAYGRRAGARRDEARENLRRINLAPAACPPAHSASPPDLLSLLQALRRKFSRDVVPPHGVQRCLRRPGPRRSAFASRTAVGLATITDAMANDRRGERLLLGTRRGTTGSARGSGRTT